MEEWHGHSDTFREIRRGRWHSTTHIADVRAFPDSDEDPTDLDATFTFRMIEESEAVSRRRTPPTRFYDYDMNLDYVEIKKNCDV